MKLRLLSGIVLAAIIAAPVLAGDLMVTGGWVRESIPGQSLAVAYPQLRNSSQRACEIAAVSADKVGKVEIHEHLHSEGKMQMRRVESVSVPPQGSLSFEPGGLHLMLLDLARPLRSGDSLALVFSAGDCGEIRAELPVKGIE